MGIRSFVVLIGLMAMVGCGGADREATDAASSDAPKAAAAVEKLSVGETGTYRSFPVGPEAQRPVWTIRLEEVRRSSSNPKFLLAKVAFEAVEQCEVSGVSQCGVSSRHFQAVLGDGSKVPGSTMDIDEPDELDSMSLKTGDSTSGVVGFAVPAGSGPFDLVYEPYPGQMDPQFSFSVDAG